MHVNWDIVFAMLFGFTVGTGVAFKLAERKCKEALRKLADDLS